MLSANKNVNVGFTSEKSENPSADNDVLSRVRLAGGFALPSPADALGERSWALPTEEISSTMAPKSQFELVPLKVALNVNAFPTICVGPFTPLTSRMPAPFVQ